MMDANSHFGSLRYPLIMYTVSFQEPASTVIRVSWWFLLVIRVIDDECKFSFWYTLISAYYVYSLVLGAGLHCYKSKLVISARY